MLASGGGEEMAGASGGKTHDEGFLLERLLLGGSVPRARDFFGLVIWLKGIGGPIAHSET